MTFKIIKEILDGLEVYTLFNENEQTKVSIAPALGNNLVSWKIIRDEKEIELIYVPKPLIELKKIKKKFFGNPLLFPFPNRIVKGKFSFKGEEIRLPINFDDGTAIHGLVYDKVWKVKESNQSELEASLTSIYESDAQIKKFFPFPFQIQVKYVLKARELSMEFLITNLGEKELPWGLGIHPYFFLNASRSDWKLQLEASSIYKLVDCIPTGEIFSIPEPMDFRKMKKLDEIYLDDLYSGFPEDGFEVVLENPKGDIKLIVESDKNFQYCIIYAPEGKNYICIEPYTCLTDAYNLEKRNIKTGLRTLAPKKSFKTIIKFKLI